MEAGRGRRRKKKQKWMKFCFICLREMDADATLARCTSRMVGLIHYNVRRVMVAEWEVSQRMQQRPTRCHFRPLENVLNSAARIILRKQITSLLTFATACIGCQFNRERGTKCACSYTSVYISQNQSTSPSYASRSQQPPNGVINVQQSKATSSFRTVGQSDMDKERTHVH